ncbi:O-methyltransferase [Pseudonocardia endophytica]|uniref:Caffeoyl-CoA O-methyltransferase n=1 Tax=Pseudonocardia endophytica TaxID=401976 RepID=A0A4R1HVY8_PSEEN|nr:class I SAM-dependent methyltransferase [Pseudonocardia endophytica]TCK25603.1 caffeoyl-CoA O-methyltransferase [Pseudonocardia endophytica]
MTAVDAQPRPVTPVTIAAERLARLAERLDGEGAAEAREIAALVGGLDPYLASCTTPESSELAALASRTRSADWGDGPLEQEMLSGHVEGRLLAFLVHATGARRVLEIGMFTGYSALAMAEALPAGGNLVACEIDSSAAALAAASFSASPAGRRIDVRVGPAVSTLDTLASAGETFDLVFVDADKAGYEQYLEILLTGGLLAPNALVCVDNTLMQGEPWTTGSPSANGAAIAAFNRAVAADPRVEQVVLPVRDGLTLIRRI